MTSDDRPQGPPDAPRAAAAIHDLGYRRYVGTRRPQSSRWRVVVRNLVSSSWRGWFRMKLWVIGAALTTVGIGVPMYIATYVSQDDRADGFLQGGMLMSWADALLPMSFQFYAWFAFVLGATVAAPQIARDLEAGAFEFYFSRPVRPIDYLLGKLGGTMACLSTILLIPPLLLGLFRVGLSQDSGEIAGTLLQVVKLVVVGGVAVLAFSAVPLALGTLSSRPRIAVASWVVYYFLFGGVGSALAVGMDNGNLAALSLPAAVRGLANGLFDVTVTFDQVPSLLASIVALTCYVALSLLILVIRVAGAERAGLGGG